MIPLSEDCGFIEWVPETVTLRNCCTGVYEAEGLFDKRLTLAGVSKIWKGFTVSAPSGNASMPLRSPSYS